MFERFRSQMARTSKVDREVSDEVSFHVEKQTELNVQAGMSPDEARRRALIEFGGVQQTREELRKQRWLPRADTFAQDVSYAFRMLRKQPGFAAVTILTLALGIGMNSAIFSVISAIMFRSLPVKDPQGLVVFRWTSRQHAKRLMYSNYGDCVEEHDAAGGVNGCSFSPPFFRSIENSDLFSGVSAFAEEGSAAFSAPQHQATMANAIYVSGGYFSMLGIDPATGRLLGPADDRLDAPSAAVLDYSFWKKLFGADPSIIGQTVRLNKSSFTVVGVTSPSFTGLTPGSPHDVYVPLASRKTLDAHWRPRLDTGGAWWLVIVGRPKPGQIKQAQAAVTLAYRAQTLNAPDPSYQASDDPQVRLDSAQEALVGGKPQALQPLYILMLCVAVVLLIACANVAGLLLSRAASRETEMAVRFTLGAHRGRIIQQLLTESLLLSLTGGAVGLALSYWGSRVLLKLTATNSITGASSVIAVPEIDWRVLAFTLGASLVTGLFFGLAPVLRGLKTDLMPSLKMGERGSSLKRRWLAGLSAGNLLVTAQVALAIVVLVSAGLLVRTMVNLRTMDPGFDTRNVLTFSIDPKLVGYSNERIEQTYERLREELAAVPGVKSVSYSWTALLSGGWMSTEFHIPGTPADKRVPADELPVGPNFFDVMKVPVLAGHDFTLEEIRIATNNAGDKSTTVPDPAIVNRLFAQKYFPNVDPIGRIFDDPVPDPDRRPEDPVRAGYRIVGVVGDAKYGQLKKSIEPTFYVPNAANAGGRAFFCLRSSVDPNLLIKSVTGVVAKVDSGLAVARISSASDLVDRQLFQETLLARFSSFFGVLALVLASLGLYGLLSYEVTRRTREIGIRMAIGARRPQVMTLVGRQALALVAVGALAGIGLSFLASRFLMKMLYGVRPGDPAALIISAVVLALVAAFACYLPARRAMQVDPIVALRHE